MQGHTGSTRFVTIECAAAVVADRCHAHGGDGFLQGRLAAAAADCCAWSVCGVLGVNAEVF
jgi:hypothetical protein